MTDFRPPIWNGVPIPYDAPIAELRATVEEPGPKAWAAIRALAAMPDTDALQTLIELSKSSDPHVRRAAVEGIGSHPFGQTASAVVSMLLHDRDHVVVRAATEAAANLRLVLTHDKILSLLNACEETTRLAALRAVESLWQSSDFEAVFDRYVHDSSDQVRKQAAWTLQKNVGADHWARLFSAWSKDSVSRHRTWACQIAGRFGNRAILPALEALRDDHNGHVRRAARQAADRVGAG